MNDWIVPDWPAPENVNALFTTRNGGVSGGGNNAYATLNLGSHVKDNLSDVEKTGYCSIGTYRQRQNG